MEIDTSASTNGISELALKPISSEEVREMMQSIFSGTTCYELIQNSAKVIVFETSINFQMAFYALLEHDAVLAPLWDPNKHTFVGLMSVADYVDAMKLCHQKVITTDDLANSSIAEMMKSDVFQLRHPDFNSIDAEDSVSQLCFHFNRYQSTFVPVVNPDDGSLLSVLGYLDVLHLLDQAAKQHPEYFNCTLSQLGININSDELVTVPLNATLASIINFRDIKQSAIPVVDANGLLVGIYHLNDINFITKAPDPESGVNNIDVLTVADLLQSQADNGDNVNEGSRLAPGSAVSTIDQKLDQVLATMMNCGSSFITIVNQQNQVIGTLCFKDLVAFFY